MRFASFRQIAILTALTAALFFGIDFGMHPRQLSHHHGSHSHGKPKPQLRLELDPACNAECAFSLRRAIRLVDWIDADHESEAEEADAVTVPLRHGEGDLRLVDFADLVRKLRSRGFYPSKLLLSGIPSFEISVWLPNACNALCVQAIGESLERTVAANEEDQRWLDGFGVDAVGGRLLVRPKVDAVVELSSILRAVAIAGFEANAVTVQVAAR